MATWIWVAFMFATGAIGLLCGYRWGFQEGRYREIHEQILAINIRAAQPKPKNPPPPPNWDSAHGGRTLELARQELEMAQWKAQHGKGSRRA